MLTGKRPLRRLEGEQECNLLLLSGTRVALGRVNLQPCRLSRQHRIDTRPLGGAGRIILCRLVPIRAKPLPSAEGAVGRDIYEALDNEYMVMNARPSRHMLDSPASVAAQDMLSHRD